MKNKRRYNSRNSWRIGMFALSIIALVMFLAYKGDVEHVSAQSKLGSSVTIYDNGPLATGTLSNSGVMAPAGTEWSEAQNETGNMTESNTLAGVSCSLTATAFRCADDFTVPPGATWTVDQVVTFAYQTGFAGGTSPITGATLRIWDGIPDGGGTVIFGDETTNRLSSSVDGFLFRIFNSAVPPPGATPGTTRRVWQNNIAVAPALVLGPGTYWVDWNTDINGVSSHFAPPVTIPGVRGLPGWNARQRIGGGVWQNVIDVGNPGTAPDFPLDFPFKLVGSAVGAGQSPQVDFDGDGTSDYSIVRDTSPPPAGPIPGTGTGPIPDGGTPCPTINGNLDIMFDASGVSGSITNVSIDIDIAHTFIGDVRATLIAPDGTMHSLFNNVGVPPSACFGNGANLVPGGYTFDDAQTGDIWAASTAVTTVPTGGYRTTGPLSSTPTSMNAAFAAANPNGTWILRIQDGAGADTGTVSAASLTITTGAPLASAGRRSIQELQKAPGFKPLGSIGKSVGPPAPGADLAWYIAVNGGNDPARVQGFGLPATDFWTPEDFDGDGQDDIAVWRGLGPTGPGGGVFFSYNSSTSTVSTTDFGQQGDNPTLVGDYDGDGTADPAVYRCPVAPGQCTFFYKGSAGGGEITYFDWGNSASGSIRPYPGDFDGDGQADFCIFQGGQYILSRSSDGGVEYINFGGALDPVIAPGDYDGDGKTDFMNIIVNGSGGVEWWLLKRAGGQTVTTWGTVAIPGFAEFATPADYDGDGKTDIGIWRRDNSSNDNSFFYTLRSSDGMLEVFEWGSMGDRPVPGWNEN